MSKIYEKLESYLSGEEWRRHAFNAIDAIPYGHVATYGYIASQVESQTGSNPGSRNVAKLRRRLYGILSHDTTLPLHRVAKQGDGESNYDSEETKEINKKRREAEGFFANPRWLK